jgi:hypothetical protein
MAISALMLSLMTLIIVTISIMIVRIMIITALILRLMTHIIMTFSIMILKIMSIGALILSMMTHIIMILRIITLCLLMNNLNKDPTVWLHGNRPANTCIRPSLGRMAPGQPRISANNISLMKTMLKLNFLSFLKRFSEHKL